MDFFFLLTSIAFGYTLELLYKIATCFSCEHDDDQIQNKVNQRKQLIYSGWEWKENTGSG